MISSTDLQWIQISIEFQLVKNSFVSYIWMNDIYWYITAWISISFFLFYLSNNFQADLCTLYSYKQRLSLIIFEG